MARSVTSDTRGLVSGIRFPIDMELASRIFSILLGLAVMVFFLWPVTIPVGFGEAWWARQQIASRSKPAPAQTAAAPTAQPASPPLQSTPTAALPSAPPQAASLEASPHAVQPSAGVGKRTLLASEKAEAERVAALNAEGAAAATPPPKTKLYYRIKVRDGGTLLSGGVVIRLDGIAVRDAEATCKGKGGKPWPCGAAVKSALTRLIRTRAVTCELPKSGEQKDFAARCTVAGTDLATWMVRQGWAEPKEGSERSLAEAAQAAKQEHVGLWRGAE
jgi:endonuclease YncB( thermonuclease family)